MKKKKTYILLSVIITFLYIINFTDLNSIIFTNCKDIIYENWDINLTKTCKEIYHTTSPSGIHGDGERYHVFEYDDKEIINNTFHWKNSTSNNIIAEIDNIIEDLKKSDNNFKDEYMINLKKDYKYIEKKDIDSSKIYIINIESKNRIYIIEDIY